MIWFCKKTSAKKLGGKYWAKNYKALKEYGQVELGGIGWNNYDLYNKGVIKNGVDLIGPSHAGIATPHVQEFVKNVNPKTGEANYNKGIVRPALISEIP